MRTEHIYKILQLSEWTSLQTDGQFSGSPVDHQDGFIHMSTSDQVQGTLDKHYTNGAELRLVEVKTDAVADEIKYEVSRGGAEFPHIYGVLSMDAVSQHWALSPDTRGRYDAARVLT